MLKKLLISTFILLIFFIYGLTTKEIIQVQIKEIHKIISKIYKDEYKRNNVLPERIFYLSQYCDTLANKDEDFVVLEFNYESEAEILRYYLYPKHIVFIVNRINDFNKLDPFIKSKNNIINRIKNFSQLIQFMKSRNIRFLIVPNVNNKIYSLITNNQKYFKPIGYEFEWGFFILN